jgi:shikimate kinase
MRTAEAVSHGAITVVNAMATGEGAALGVRLWTKARVTLTDNPGQVQARILGDSKEDTSLIRTTVLTVLKKYAAQRHYGAIAETESNIPIAVGLKSSSAASNAIAAATITALGRRPNDLECVRLGVLSSKKAGVTLTGAFDDACACYFGGLTVTNNRSLTILKRYRPSSRRLHVLLHVPKMKKYSVDVHQSAFKGIERFVDLAHQEALRHNYLLALTVNGIAYSNVFGYDISRVTDAFHEGALAAGLSGKGPAVAAIIPDRKVDHLLSAWESYPGRVIETVFNFQKCATEVLP